MTKSIKSAIIFVLAFFILGASTFCQPLTSQDIKTLDNGLRIIIKENYRNPLVSISCFIAIGSADEGKYSGYGISHLIEHTLFKGTKKYPLGTIEETLHKYGGSITAFTSYDYTGFSITILKENVDIALDVLKEMLSSPLFNKAEIKKEKEVIEREMDRNIDEPLSRLSRLTFSKAYIRHPYRIPIIGYKENFRTLERKDLIRFFKSTYTPEKIVISIVGDIDKNTTFNKIDYHFGNMKRGRNYFSIRSKEPEQIATRYVEEKKDIVGAYLYITFHSTGILNKDLYALDILSFVLGQGESSILNQSVRIKKELVLSISSYNYTPLDPGLFIISSTLKEENVQKAIEEITSQIDIVKEKPVREEDLVKAKNNLLAEYIYQKEEIESQSNTIAIGELLTGDPNFFTYYIDHIKSVTLDDLQYVARKYLNKDNMTIAVLSKSGSTLLNIGIEPVIKGTDRQIKKMTLGNKLPVLICQDTSIPTVSIALLFKGGLRFETEENNGISKITSCMFMDGTNSMTRENIAQYYETKGMLVTTYSTNNSIGIIVQCLKEDVQDALRLISNLSTNSVFPEKELAREKNEFHTIIDIQDNDLFNYGHRLLKENLFKKHPYRFQNIGTHKSIDRIKKEDVIKFYNTISSSDNMVIGISGDCDADSIMASIETYFSGFPLTGPKPPPPAVELPIDKRREIISNIEKEQSLILVGFHGIDIYSSDRFPMEIMMDVLSGGSGVLFKSIRDTRGLAYSTGAFQISGINPGYVAIYALTSKKNIDKVKGIIFREISSFIKRGVTTEVLENSKTHLKAMRRVSIQTNSNFIFSASLDELYGLGYTNYKNYDKDIDLVTKEDIKRVAKKYLTLDNSTIIILKGKD